MLPVEEFEIYGRFLTGEETDLELDQLARTRFLKLKMRERLAAEIGDCEDNVTDVLRGVLLCYAVSSGIIKDAAVIARLTNYVTQMLEGYGGASAVMDVLEFDAMPVMRHVKEGYFAAKVKIGAAKTTEEIAAIDIDEKELPF